MYALRRAGLHGSRVGGGSSAAASAELAAELAMHASMEGGAAFHLKGSSPIMR